MGATKAQEGKEAAAAAACVPVLAGFGKMTNGLLAQIANWPITWEQFNTFRHVDNLLMFKSSIGMGKKGD